MKYTILFLIGLHFANFCLSQKQYSFEFKVDSIAIDGRNIKAIIIDDKLQIGSPRYFKIFDEDSLAIRIRVKLTERGSQKMKYKIRVDLFEEGRWYKAPFYIDIHNFTRFRIRRDQCWMRSIGYSPMLPDELQCRCRKPLKGKKSHEFYLRSKAVFK